jgi:hypothetical protein
MVRGPLFCFTIAVDGVAGKQVISVVNNRYTNSVAVLLLRPAVESAVVKSVEYGLEQTHN